jgi:arsenate reductase (glutaredoxin)
MKLYHNPRCAKSRQTLALLKEKGIDPVIVLYLVDLLTYSELSNLIELLKITPVQLVRKGETIWKDNFKGKTLTDQQIIEAMIAHPKLIERPIVVKGTRAVLGRPPENVLQLL